MHPTLAIEMAVMMGPNNKPLHTSIAAAMDQHLPQAVSLHNSLDLHVYYPFPGQPSVVSIWKTDAKKKKKLPVKNTTHFSTYSLGL